MRAFVDTGAWYALFNDLDIYHPRASAFMQKLIGQKAQLFTSDYVIDETLTLMRARLGYAKAVEFGKWVLQSQLVKRINVDDWTLANFRAGETQQPIVDRFQGATDRRVSERPLTSVPEQHTGR